MPYGAVRILGVDPALRTTGYGAIERRNGRVHLVEAGVVVPRASGTLEERLRELHDGICEVIAQTARRWSSSRISTPAIATRARPY